MVVFQDEVQDFFRITENLQTRGMRRNPQLLCISLDIPIGMAEGAVCFLSCYFAQGMGTELRHDLLKGVLAYLDAAQKPFMSRMGKLMEKNRLIRRGKGYLFSS